MNNMTISDSDGYY